jgi:Ca2+-binding EF-hand superfamily protein
MGLINVLHSTEQFSGRISVRHLLATTAIAFGLGLGLTMAPDAASAQQQSGTQQQTGTSQQQTGTSQQQNGQTGSQQEQAQQGQQQPQQQGQAQQQQQQQEQAQQGQQPQQQQGQPQQQQQQQQQQQAAGGQQAGQGQQQMADRCPDMYAPIDLDEDDQITAEEARTQRQQAYQMLDDDGDGTVSQQEYLECMGAPKAAAMQGQRDPGAMQRTEDQFSVLDMNGDGMVTRSEFMYAAELTYINAAGQDRTMQPDQFGEAMGPYTAIPGLVDYNNNDQVQPGEAAANVVMSFDMLDENSDRFLTQDEWTGQQRQSRAERQFARLDENNDNQLSQDEFVQAGMAAFAQAQQEAAARREQQAGQKAGQQQQQPPQAVAVELVPIWVYRVYIPEQGPEQGPQ